MRRSIRGDKWWLKFTVRTIGVDTAKDLPFARLRNEFVGPGYCHFPINYEMDYFLQLTAEARVTSYTRTGQLVKKWIKLKGRRNEALDCRVYAWAAYNGLVSERRLKLSTFLPKATSPEKIEKIESHVVEPTPTHKKHSRKSPIRSSYITN